MSSKDFIAINNRDAWNVIRGFVYQVQHTILTWIRLEEHERLELEKGEDFDVVREAIEYGPTQRELAQVKYRESSLTLNSDMVLDSIMNFYTHRKNNAALGLRFHFITNTGYSIERPAIFKNGKGGIEVWIELFNDPTVLQGDTRLEVIQTHLLKKLNSKKTNEKDHAKITLYQDLCDYIANSNDLLSLIKSITWQASSGSDSDLHDQIQSDLVQFGLVAEPLATQLYARLFLHVFRVLSKAEDKFLDKSTLVAQSRLPELSQSDNTLIQTVELMLGSFQQRLSHLEEEIKDNTAALWEHISAMETAGKMSTVFHSRHLPMATVIANLVHNASLRKQKVGRMQEMLLVNSWIHVQGINGTGKTQLAALLSRNYDQCWWLDLRSYSDNNLPVALVVKAFLSNISQVTAEKDSARWLKQVCAKLPDGCLLIINDLPAINRDVETTNILACLANEFKQSKRRLVTTGNYDLQRAVNQLVAPEILTTFTDLDFDDSEILEFLSNSGVDPIYYPHVHLIATRTKRNPRLLSSVVYHLLQIEPQTDNEAVLAILDRDVTESILNDVQYLVRSYIRDDAARELLYRLSLIHWNYPFSIIQRISDIGDKIVHPREKLSYILHIWIQLQGTSYLTSPLAYDLGKDNLPDTTRKETYRAAGLAIVEDGILDPVIASRAITVFLAAEEFDHAGQILVAALNSVKTADDARLMQEWGFLEYWRKGDLPVAMNLTVKMIVRVEQRRVYQILGEEYLYYSNELIRYYNEAEEPQVKALIAISIASAFDAEDSSFFTYFNYALEHIELLKMPGEQKVDLKMFGQLIWSPILYMFDTVDVKRWIQAVDLIKSKLGLDVLKANIAPYAITSLKDRLVKQAGQIVNEAKYRQLTLEKLGLLLNYFSSGQYQYLASIISAEIARIDFYTNQPVDTVTYKANSLYQSYDDADAKYILAAAVGKFLYPGPDSRQWLERAVATNKYSQHTFSETLVFNAATIQEQQLQLAKTYCLTAYNLMRYNSEFETDHLQYLGELALAHWKTGDSEKVYECFRDYFDGLFDLQARDKIDPLWYRLFVLGAHALSYISAILTDASIPKYSNGVEFIMPDIGFFTVNGKDNAFRERYKKENDPLVMVYMANLANAINDKNAAYQWATRAFDLSRRQNNNWIISMVSMVCCQYTIINNKFETAFEQYLVNALLSAHTTAQPEKRTELLNTLSLETLQLDKPSSFWSSAEDTTLLFAIAPMCMSVITAILTLQQDADILTDRFLTMVQEYNGDASDKKKWQQASEIVAMIFTAEDNADSLAQLANSYAVQEEDKHLQILCLIGVVHKTPDDRKAILQLINVVPYLQKTLDKTIAVIRSILVPFVKAICANRLKNISTVNKEDLNTYLSRIDLIDNKEPRALQHIIQVVAGITNVQLNADRSDWLYDYKQT